MGVPARRLRDVAGRIREDDIAEVREKARIDDVVSGYVTLRKAGGGSLKGLCPFHDEKSPSLPRHPAAGSSTAWRVRPACSREGARDRSVISPAACTGSSAPTHTGSRLRSGLRRTAAHKITLTRNRQVKELFATDGHRWFIRSGKGRKNSRELLTSDLKAGDTLVTKFPRSKIRRSRPSPFGIAHGFTFGDGTRSGTGSMALLCPPKDSVMLKWFPQ